ncbi:MAG: hypothetical protein J5850_02675, partial [Clostridia bacterium]|nr:hypothetical protein [Clostridia bacterium]
CYSACSDIKKNNRKSEHRMIAAESYSVLSGKLIDTPYPSEEFERAWKNVLFNQFHDIMGGCSIRPAYEQAIAQHGETQAIADRNINFACQQISWNIDTIGDIPLRPDKPGWGAGWSNEGVGTPIVVFNSHPWEVTAFVTVHDLPKRITDENGALLPSQSVRAPRTNHRDKWEKGFLITIPALGYRTLRAFYTGDEETLNDSFVFTDCSVENELIRLTFCPETGELCGFTDKTNGKEYLSGHSSTVMIDETDSDTWAHGIKAFRKVAEVFRNGKIQIIERGPVRATVRTWQYGENTIVRRDYSIITGSKSVIVNTKIDFHERHRMLKFIIPSAVDDPEILCEIPFGSIKRPADGSEQVCHRWFAAVDSGRQAGLAVLNDSSYSFSADASNLELTVLRGAIWADHYGERDEFCEYMEQGEREMTYALMPFESVGDTVRRSAEINQRPFAVLETFHKGRLPQSYSGLSVSHDNIIVTAIKKHEDSDAVVLRAYECEGKDTEVKFTLFGSSFKAFFGHNSVKTFIIEKDNIIETDFLED